MTWNYGNFIVDLELKGEKRNSEFETFIWGESIRKLTEDRRGLEITVDPQQGIYSQSKVFFFTWEEIESLTFTKKECE